MLEQGDFQLHISNDKMEATLTILNAQAVESISVASLREFLLSKGVKAGVDEAALAAIAGAPAIGVPKKIARGTALKDGQNEKIDYKFAGAEDAKVEENESGSVDFRKVKNFSNFRQDDILAIKTPATPGSPGVTVMGEELKARDGKTVPLRVGKGARLTEDGTAVIAEVSGHACLVGDRVSVLSTVEVPATVNYAVGNISFIGSVKIRGGVMPGFVVEAEGDIEVGENVEKATLRCSGNLEIRGMVFGQGDCHIEVGGDAKIGSLDQADVKVRGNLTVNSYIRHSNVLCGGMIEVIGKKGNIIGGDLRSFRGIVTPYLGNAMATPTRLTIGSNPFSLTEIQTLEKQKEELEVKLKQISAALTGVINRRLPNAPPDPQMMAMIDKLKQASAQLTPQLDEVNAKLAKVQSQVADYREAKIRVGDIAYPGVMICFRDKLQYKTMDEAQHLCFYEEEAEVRTGPY